MVNNDKNNVSPIQQAIDAIASVVDPGGPIYRCTLDCDVEAMQFLGTQLASCEFNNKRILFLQTPFRKQEYMPWVKLFESVVETSGIGVVCDLEGVVEAIRRDRERLDRNPHNALAPSGDMLISPFTEPQTNQEIAGERSCLQNWAVLESLADGCYLPAFSHVTGGMQPLVVVFDDYNNYIHFEDGCFTPLDKNQLGDVAEQYCSSNDDPPKELHGILKGYCRNLNHLCMAFDVRAPRLWVSASEDPDYAQVARAMPMQWLQDNRKAIAAFVVDLEWQPTLGVVKSDTDSGKNWSEMGYRAIYWLSQCFPEIPSFVFTGERPYQKLQEAQAHGASWCFRKTHSHHGFEGRNSDRLTALALEQHLHKAALVMYGAFSEAPYPDQLVIESGSGAGKALIDKLGLKMPVGCCPRGKDLQRLVAKVFPNGDEIQPVKVFSSGKSKAQAAFVVRPSRNGIQYATRFMKVAPWLEIQREYLAYQSVIRPRLNTYVASIMERPVLAGGIQGEMPLGAVVYSMAGLPEGYADLESLHDLLKRRCIEDDGGERVAKRLHETLEQVLLHLYGAGGEKKIKKAQRPLWDWLGEVLPPAFTGVLIPLDQLDDGNTNTLAVRSWRQQEYKDNTAWLMAAGDTRNIQEKAIDEKNLSPWNLKGEQIKLDGFHLLEIEWDNDGNTGEITLAHPDLGWRIRLRGKADDIRRRFGAIWTRPGLPVEVSVIIEEKNQEFEKIKRKLRTAFAKTGIDTKLEGKESDSEKWLDKLVSMAGTYSLVNPFELFDGEKQIPYSFTITAHQSPVHGDLNLHNILFSGEAGPGWLIDFDRSNLCGMPAFDLAKLETEIWHHHLFPLLEKLTNGMVDKAIRCLKLLHAAQTAADADCNSGEIFVSLVRTGEIIKEATDGLLLPVCNLLSVIATIREFGRERLKLDDTELHWALASYFFIATKFASDKQPWRAIFFFFSSARHLASVAPLWRTESGEELWKKTFKVLVDGGQDAVDKQEIDGLLLKMTKAPDNLDKFTKAMARSRDEYRVEWPKELECWDLASTGSITNITPIFGYLWLMVKAAQSKDKKSGEFSVVVPKISSTGASCGTVDILESGGLSFPSEPDAIKEACLRDGGVLCQQHESLTPIDKVLMKRRKKTNTMKNVALVYASILAKKIAMGCTDAIVDVKVGRDTKILAPWMDDNKNKVWLGIKNKEPKQTQTTEQETAKQEELNLICPDMGTPFQELLKSNEMLGGNTDVLWKEEKQWVEQTCDGVLSPLEEVRWFFTNADMPQCRAIGRQLILLHLDDIILGTYGDELLDDNKDKDNAYKKLYKEFLPKICDVKDRDQDDWWEKLQDQWRLLKLQLPGCDKFPVKLFFDDLQKWRDGKNPEEQAKIGVLAQAKFEKGQELVENMDLRIITLAVGSYQPSAVNGQIVQRIDAWRLDSFFDWLCGEESFDHEVGIYLHCLPGENVSNPHKNPFISVCYRPSRCPESEVLQRVRCFLSEGVEIGKSTQEKK